MQAGRPPWRLTVTLMINKRSVEFGKPPVENLPSLIDWILSVHCDAKWLAHLKFSPLPASHTYTRPYVHPSYENALSQTGYCGWRWETFCCSTRMFCVFLCVMWISIRFISKCYNYIFFFKTIVHPTGESDLMFWIQTNVFASCDSSQFYFLFLLT